MKNLNYIINGVLAAAVIVLFVLYFTGESGKENEHHSSASEQVISQGGGSIAYFKVDSVMSNWKLYFDMQDELASKQTQLETDFEKKSQSYMKRVEDAQYKIQRGLVTRAEIEQLQQQLAAEEQNLVNLQQNYGLQMQEEGLVKNRQMIDKLEQFIKSYNADKKYTYIFSYAFGGNLLYGDDAYDITDEVISGINEMFPAKEE